MEVYKREESEKKDVMLVGVGSPEEAGTQHGVIGSRSDSCQEL